MSIRSLAESIIIQSLEDISDHRHRSESLEFFAGNDFRVCARLAGMNQDDQIATLKFVRSLSEIPLKMGIEFEKTAQKTPSRSRTRKPVRV